VRPSQTRARLDELVAICGRAGEAILEVYREDFAVQQKSDASPLTKADLASHHIICDALERLDPSIPVLSEESAAIPFSERSAWNRYWLVDPLDGTKEFVNRNGEFTVNIALIENHVPVMGVVHVPVSNTSYFGARSLGAFKRNKGEISPISVRAPASDPLIVVGSRSHANPELLQQLEALGSFELVSMGSSLKFCLVAEGEADFYPRLGPTSEWDTGAAQAVVEAAGGRVDRLDGSPLRYNTRDSLLNPHFLVYGDPGKPWTSILPAPPADA
jgi:3'(2'), 5'-bisphosphate nucleotidase